MMKTVCSDINERNAIGWGSIIVWRLGGFGPILDAEYGCCKKINAVYGFCVAKRLRKIGI